MAGPATGRHRCRAVLGALCGCESVTFSRTAAEMGLDYRGIDFEAEFRLDIRGRLGNRNVRPYFHTVRVEARVDTDAAEDDLRAVIDEPERRCPVFNLLSDAGVELEMQWIRTTS